MAQTHLFTILDRVESTNNYAMGQVHAGLSTHGHAWFAREQTAGKGQREKKWESNRNENILMSIAIKPGRVLQGKLFMLSVVTANVCHQVVGNLEGIKAKIKWPNDIYIGDRKAGGLLIENIIKGEEWSWSIVGIGINVNQILFEDNAANATSLKMVTVKSYNEIDLAKQIQSALLLEIQNLTDKNQLNHIEYYNENLYKKDSKVKIKQGTIVFETTIRRVNQFGYLITEDALERQFKSGEIRWMNNV